MITYNKNNVVVGLIDDDLKVTYRDHVIIGIHDKDVAKDVIDGFVTAFQKKEEFVITSDEGYTIFSATNNGEKYFWDLIWTLRNYDNYEDLQIKDSDLLCVIIAMADASVGM